MKKDFQEYLNNYIKCEEEIKNIELNILELRKLQEKALKELKIKLHKARQQKDKLSQEVFNNKMVSISILDLIKEISKVTNISVFDLDYRVKTNFEFAGAKKKTLKQVASLISEANQDKYKDDCLLEIEIVSEDIKKPFKVSLLQPLNVESKLNNGDYLLEYCTLNKDVREENGESVCYTRFNIKASAWGKIMYTFNLNEIMNTENFIGKTNVIKKAVLSYIENQKEKELEK